MNTPADWHPDPLGRHEYRYWDGNLWTEHVSNGGQLARDPMQQGGPSPASGQAVAHSPSGATATAASNAGGVTPVSAGTPPQGVLPDQQVAQVQQPAQAQQPVQQQAPAASTGGQSNGIALAAMIVGLLSLLISWIPFIGLLGVLGGIIAVVLGMVGRGRAKKIASGAGMAITGLITGVLALLAGIASTALPVLFFQGAAGDIQTLDSCLQETGDEAFCIEEYGSGWIRFLDGLDD